MAVTISIGRASGDVGDLVDDDRRARMHRRAAAAPLLGDDLPSTRISPPHTPHISSRSSAPARHGRAEHAAGADRLGPGQLDRVVGEEQVGERAASVGAAGPA